MKYWTMWMVALTATVFAQDTDFSETQAVEPSLSTPTAVVQEVDRSETQGIEPSLSTPTAVVQEVDRSETQGIEPSLSTPTAVVQEADPAPARTLDVAPSSATAVVAKEAPRNMNKEDTSSSMCGNCLEPHGWSLEVGGQYNRWFFTTPPTFRGNVGGVTGKITYQEPWSFFGQLRSVYNTGATANGLKKSHDNEWYTEVVGGYCFCAMTPWTVTPYVGVGLDFLNDLKNAYLQMPSVHLHYRSYYALLGFDTHYHWQSVYVGLQAEALPVFHQYLSIGSLAGSAWKMEQRWGVAVRLPVGFQLVDSVWMEFVPFYRLLPIGASSVLDLPERTLNQWGISLSFRFFP